MCYKKFLFFWMYSPSIFDGEFLGEGKVIIKVVIFCPGRGGKGCCYLCKS